MMCWHRWEVWNGADGEPAYRECLKCHKRQGRVLGMMFGHRWIRLGPRCLEGPRHGWRMMTDEEAQRAYDEAEPVSMTDEQIDRYVDVTMGKVRQDG